jgi:hypothetical protein
MASPRETYTVEQLEAILKEHRPHLIIIEEAVEEFRNGVITFHLRVQDGRGKDVVTVETHRTVLN